MNNNQMLQRAEKLAAEMQTGIYAGRAQIVYSYGCYGYTRGGGATWHGGLDLVGLDDTFIRMPYYKGTVPIRGTVTRARIVTDHGDKTWEWGYYICVQLDAGQTPDEINFLYFCHCRELLVQVGQKVQSGDVLAIMGQTGNAAGGYDHCHFETRATATGTGVDPTAYAGVPNAAGTYGSTSAAENPARDISNVPNSELNEIQLVTIGPLTAAQMQEVDALAEQQGLSEDRYRVMTADEGYQVAVLSVSSGDAMQYMALAQRNGWDKLQRYHSRFVG